MKIGRNGYPMFETVYDSCGEKIRGLWRRANRYYAQLRVKGKKSPIKIALQASDLAEARAELERVRIKNRGLESGAPAEVEPEISRTGSEFAFSDWPYQRPCTKKELAQGTRASVRLIEQEVNRGHLRAVHIGRRSVRFLPSDVLRWLHARPTTGI